MNPPALSIQAGDQQCCEALVQQAATALLDPQGRQLAAAVQWWPLAGLPGRWPLAVLGAGPPLLLLHGFDSSFLEFRRLAPLLAGSCQLFIPDLFGFGFTPRPHQGPFNPAGVLAHLEALLGAIAERGGTDQPGEEIGLIGASMGGAVAVELARRQAGRIGRLLLLAPAGLGGRPQPVPPPLNRLGAALLGLPAVRRRLCREAFADPKSSVGPAEEQIASLHLAVPGWSEALAGFARSGGFAGAGSPLPTAAVRVLWGENDRILRPPERRQAAERLGERLEMVPQCGHLPHLDLPALVARRWREPWEH